MRSMLIPTKNEFYATCVACLGTLLCGVDLSFSADLISHMRDMSITIQEQSLIGSINLYGRAVSSLVITYLLNIIGRKNSLLLILLCHVIAWVLMYFFSFSMTVVYVSRAFSGFASGMRTPTTLYITETGHETRRGILISILGLSVSLGISMTYVIQYFFSWHTVALVSLVFSVVGFIQTCFLRETKYWYLYKNNVEKAKESIKWFNNSLTEAEVQAEIDEILLSDSQLKNPETNILTSLKSRTNLKYFTYGMLLFTFLFGCGRIQITAYPYNYYTQFQLPLTYTNITLIQGILEIVMSVICSLTVDLVPRRKMTHICCWSMNACLLVVLFHNPLVSAFDLIGQWVLVVSMMIFYGLGCGFLVCLISIMMAEIVSVTTEARGILQSVIYVWANLISAVYNQLFPYVLVAVPVNYVLLFFFINLALLSVTGFIVPETRGKALHLCSAGKPAVLNEKNSTSK